MAPPPSLFGFHQQQHQQFSSPFNQPHFISSPFGANPFQHDIGANFSFSSSSSSSGGFGGGMSRGGFSSKSVSTSTRIVNGVVESVKVTKITDQNVSKKYNLFMVFCTDIMYV